MLITESPVSQPTPNAGNHHSMHSGLVCTRRPVVFIARARVNPWHKGLVPFTFESLFVTLKPHDLTIGVIYSTPNSNKEEFLKYFQVIVDRLKKGNEQYMILGDFNIDILNYYSDTISFNFVNTIFENGCIPVITKPTRVTDSSASCIDNIITNINFPQLESLRMLATTSRFFLPGFLLIFAKACWP